MKMTINITNAAPGMLQMCFLYLSRCISESNHFVPNFFFFLHFYTCQDVITFPWTISGLSWSYIYYGQGEEQINSTYLSTNKIQKTIWTGGGASHHRAFIFLSFFHISLSSLDFKVLKKISYNCHLCSDKYALHKVVICKIKHCDLHGT